MSFAAKELFKRLDRDGNGLVSREEFRYVMPVLGIKGQDGNEPSGTCLAHTLDTATLVGHTRLIQQKLHTVLLMVCMDMS